MIAKAADYKPKRNHIWIKTLALAACLAVVIFAGVKLLPNGSVNLPVVTDSGSTTEPTAPEVTTVTGTTEQTT